MICIDDEIPFEIPVGWEWCRLREITSLISKGSSPSWQGVKYVEQGIPFITSENVREGYIDFSSPKFLERSFNELQSRSILKQGDILTNIVGASIGRTALFDLKYDNCNINQAVAIIRLIDLSINTYVLQVLNTPFFITQMLGKVVETARPNISLGSIENLFIPIPPSAEQKRIIAQLLFILPFITHYKNTQKNLEELNASIKNKLHKSILQEAIQGRLVPQDSNDEPATILLERIKTEKLKLVKEGKLKKKDIVDSVIFKGDDNKYYERIGSKVSDISEEIPFEIPATWQWMRLEFLANIYTGNSISESEKKIRYTNVDGVDYIGTKDVGFDSQINYSNGISIPQQYLSAFKIAQIGSILMCIEGGSAGRKIGILNKNVCFGNKLCCFTPYVVMAEYIYYYLQSPSFFELFQNNKTGIIGGVSVNTLKRLLVAIPPINEQIRIVEKINELNRL